TALMKEALKTLRDKYGCKEVYLEVRVSNLPAIKLYEKRLVARRELTCLNDEPKFGNAEAVRELAQLIDRLAEAGLDRVNFSIETLDPDKARKLYGAPWYDLKRVISLIEYLVKETPIDLHVTPVWLPGINDEDIPKIIKWALKIGAGKKWPPATVQKYVVHKYGRKLKGVREVSWADFWRWLESLEQKLGVKLRYTMEEWGMRYAPQIEPPVRVGEVVRLQVVARGWLRGEAIGVLLKHNWLATIAPAKHLELGEIVKVKIVHDKDGILLGRPV
ncbi:MAG TPA: GNAT family N-acetyltransferase, partial [Pyrodictiaceae archaeon]|nr:GNAT family N-acetyltransferase [Pyrodictiaceae archaeon]